MCVINIAYWTLVYEHWYRYRIVSSNANATCSFCELYDPLLSSANAYMLIVFSVQR